MGSLLTTLPPYANGLNIAIIASFFGVFFLIGRTLFVAYISLYSKSSLTQHMANPQYNILPPYPNTISPPPPPLQQHKANPMYSLYNLARLVLYKTMSPQQHIASSLHITSLQHSTMSSMYHIASFNRAQCPLYIIQLDFNTAQSLLPYMKYSYTATQHIVAFITYSQSSTQHNVANTVESFLFVGVNVRGQQTFPWFVGM